MNKETYVRVEYDVNYTGGEYSGVGQFAYIPTRLIESLQGDLARAFETETGVNAFHIIHYSSDEQFDKDGELIREEKSMTDNDLDLPFDLHYWHPELPEDKGRRGAALIFTTESAFPDDPNSEDRCQCDEVAMVECDNDPDKGEDRAWDMAYFITCAMNAYVETPEGLEHWKKTHPLIDEMRKAGRQ